MSTDAKRFRDRATDCRNIAKGTRYEVDRVMLEEIAEELDAEADRIEAAERIDATELKKGADHA